MDKLLLVDSDAYEGELVQKCLARAGYDVMMVTGAAGISAKIRMVKPDLIIIRAALDKESGYDVCKRLKESGKTEYIPVLLLCDKDEALRAVEAGADDHLSVENEPHQLLSKTNTLLRIKRLSDQLKDQYMELEAKDRLLNSQLKMAMKVQRSIVKEYDINYGGAHIYSRYVPALEIGGDYYDVITSDGDRITILVGDVSGHGISSALLVAMLHSMARGLASRYSDPGKFLSRMNQNFLRTFENRDSQMYVSMFCAVINIRDMTITYSNAGHVLPIHLCKDEKTAVEMYSAGKPIGMMNDSYYENITREYKTGDILVFHTDGLSDNNSLDMDFIEWLKKYLLDNEDQELDIMADAILGINGLSSRDESDKYRMDDMSLVLCRL
ncbi:MAG: fused response regulator/phosphatase [Clostridiales bacterium]|jgi:sigma-B regulation protein RsbU (phosphoserine phosphatase)|nr:fused response regulator/phosphatase [Clostridiales bacterium]